MDFLFGATLDKLLFQFIDFLLSTGADFSDRLTVDDLNLGRGVLHQLVKMDVHHDRTVFKVDDPKLLQVIKSVNSID